MYSLSLKDTLHPIEFRLANVQVNRTDWADPAQLILRVTELYVRHSIFKRNAYSFISARGIHMPAPDPFGTRAHSRILLIFRPLVKFRRRSLCFYLLLTTLLAAYGLLLQVAL